MMSLKIQNQKRTLHFRAIVIFVISCLLTQVTGTVKSVFTYKQLSIQLGQLVTSSTLVWESFANDPKQSEYAVQGGKYITEYEHYPIYVCRAIIDGIYTSGHTEKRRQKTICVISMHMEVKTHHAFDILINRGHGGKLTWKSWSKFSAGIPMGAVSASESNVENSYVARHKVKTEAAHYLGQQAGEIEHYGADYNLGRFDPSNRLGKIIVSEEDREMEYEEGEVLVETEPIRYELRDIKIDKWRIDRKFNQTQLGAAVLANTEDASTLVETVITYDYDRIQYWGTHDGVARGLPTRVFENSSSVHDINWALKYSEKRVETKAVNTELRPGTALNVTLKGNYSSMEAPYTATLVAYYADGDVSVSKKISSVVQKADMFDIKLDFSPVYWTENGTFIPTTTTTTSTTTTTEPTTTSTKEPKPAYSPPTVRYDNKNGSKKNFSDMNDSNDIVVDESREAPLAIGDTVKQANVGVKGSSSSDAFSIGHQSFLMIVGGCFTLVSMFF